jgi:tRNA/tmRNA/rRNA uracil-C5-methylase (TrmA/RlmC/RlmD family)
VSAAELLELVVGPPAHGGHCVARHEGRVVFVRHALPGERVRARVTEDGDDARYWRADAVEVLEASPDRVERPCPWAGPGRCGGCDWQHARPQAQRRMKGEVVREQLRRLAGLDVDVEVEAVPGPGVDHDAGLGWRTRTQLAVDDAGRAGLRAHRSHRVVPVDQCPISHPRVAEVGAWDRSWPGTATVEVVAPAVGEDRLLVLTPRDPRRGVPRAAVPPRAEGVAGAAAVAVRGPAGLEQVRGRTWVAEEVDLPTGPRRFRVTGSGFWQVHPGAGRALVTAVLDALEPAAGERALDLYAGAGLFAAALADAVGPGGAVTAVEGDARAAADARRNLHDAPQVRVVHDRVDGRLAGVEAADVVVLDPPRTGARRPVVEAVAALRPRAVAYVACDPASLARDLATFAEAGYGLAGLRAYDLFPQTHHVECVALLERTGSGPR